MTIHGYAVSCGRFNITVIFHAFVDAADFFFSKSHFQKFLRNTIRVSNSLDPGQNGSGSKLFANAISR